MRRALTAALLAATTALAGTCADTTTTETEDLLRSIVGVEASGCSLVASLGSGTIVESGRVVTSAHTVAGSGQITIIDAGGRSLPATLVGFDPDKDLAVLSVPDLRDPPLTLARAEGGESGWVLAWNRAEGAHAEPMTVTKRIRVTIEDIYVDEIVERGAIEIDAEVVPGDSGGAVVTSAGDVVGVVYATSRTRPAAFALNDEEIAAALRRASREAVSPGPCL